MPRETIASAARSLRKRQLCSPSSGLSYRMLKVITCRSAAGSPPQAAMHSAATR